MLDRLMTAFENQRGTIVLWTPVGLSLGIGLYFSLPVEPRTAVVVATAIFAAVALVSARYTLQVLSVVIMAMALISLGLTIAVVRTNHVAAPVLHGHYYGAVQGRIVAIDRAASDRARITLDQVRLENTAPDKTPKYVRISLHYSHPVTVPAPGQNVMITARLSPPSSPAEPYGFDFQRHAWFKSLGAVGFSRTPLLQTRPPDRGGFSLRLFRLRQQLSNAIIRRVPGQAGAFASAIITGDRAHISPAILTDLRASNLAHLLAISGLHMGLLSGFVFALVRYGLALFPAVSQRLPAKKIAAVTALVAASGYLGLSGANVATQRAFVMVSVMLLAILLDRRALSLRAVALAAIIVLVWRPESLISAGFQMSFAATTALVAVFSAIQRDPHADRATIPHWRRRAWPVFALILSSAVAGAATAPIAAVHFNQIARFGLVANLLSVPVMGMVIMPAAVSAALLYPVGLAGAAFKVMAFGIDWILLVAGWVAGFDTALQRFSTPRGPVLGLLALGFLVIVIWRGRGRMAGLVPVVVALVLWQQSVRPDVLISANGRLVGQIDHGVRWLNRARGNGFVARSWLENDGSGLEQGAAFALWEDQKFPDDNDFQIGSLPMYYLWGKQVNLEQVVKLCRDLRVVAVPQWVGQPRVKGCRVLDRGEFRRMGAIAVSRRDGVLKITGARVVSGARPWNTQKYVRISPTSRP